MPLKPLHPCNHHGCRELVRERYCAKHKPDERQYDQHRGTAAERGYDSKWRKAREAYLRKHPLCVHCEREGIVKAAEVVDHIIPHKGDSLLFWDVANNWQPLCKQHHDKKTAREDGGFGR
jgi:5-methylcytosine-specific restriction enzyme A